MDIPFENKTIPQILQDVAEEMCQHYCKYPEVWDAEAAGVELSESDICAACPLNRLT